MGIGCLAGPWIFWLFALCCSRFGRVLELMVSGLRTHFLLPRGPGQTRQPYILDLDLNVDLGLDHVHVQVQVEIQIQNPVCYHAAHFHASSGTPQAHEWLLRKTQAKGLKLNFQRLTPDPPFADS